MDNIIEIVVFLIFILISILGGLNKDKKKQKNSKPFPKRTEREDSPTIFEPKSDRSFEEVILEPNYDENLPESYESTSWNPEADYDNKTLELQNKIQPAINTSLNSMIAEPFDRSQGTRQNVQSTIDYIAIKIPKRISERTLHFRKVFENPQNLSDYIIISEILGKPKALRR